MKPILIAGRHAVWHALKAERRRVYTLFLQKDVEARDLQQLAQARGIPIKAVDKGYFTNNIALDTPQGIAAEVEELRFLDLEELLRELAGQARQRLLLLDGVEDPHNLGALLRSAASFNIDGVIWTHKRSAPLSAVAVKAAAGAVEYLRLVKVTNLNQCISALKENSYWIYGAAPEGTQSLWAETFPAAAALVIGGEGQGLHRLTREQCDILLTIPCSGPIESLNASVAGGILLAQFSLKP